MSDKELIKQEIEKYTKEEALKSNGSEFYGGRVSMCTKILSFIDSLPEGPASEDKSEKELAEAYLAVFDRKYPILPTLKGKQKADFKNFLNKCQQEFGLKEYGIHPTQAKLFEKLTLLWATCGDELQLWFRSFAYREKKGKFSHFLMKYIPMKDIKKLSAKQIETFANNSIGAMIKTDTKVNVSEEEEKSDFIKDNL